MPGCPDHNFRKARRTIFESGVSLCPRRIRLRWDRETSSTDSSSTGSMVAVRSVSETNSETHSLSVRPRVVMGGRRSFVIHLRGDRRPSSSPSSRAAASLYDSPLRTCPVEESVHRPGCHRSRLLLCCSRTLPLVLSTRMSTAL